jgi:Zn-dependent peptidase ImmA (M78 family)/transcriptional regulator with XRE-family HTH domain
MEEERLKEAREVRRLFDGGRLRVARELRGLTQQAVAEAADITSTAVGQFEKGTSTPNARTLVSLADALRFPLPFFRDDIANSEPDTPAFFRSLRSTSVRDQRQARAFVELVREFTLALETKVELPQHDIPRHPMSQHRKDRGAVEAVAGLVREELGLWDGGPVDNVVRHLERHGAVVTRTEFEARKIDAFSVAYEDRPVVVLCSDKGLYDRSRFDAAHELGHLVMHDRDDCGHKATEDQANQFAAAFLMPENGVAEHLPEKADWSELVALKREWGVSIAALLFRAKTLGVMSDSDYLSAVKTMSARGWRKKEPEDLGRPESPRLLHKAVAVLNDEGVTVEDLASLAALPVGEVERILDATSPTKPRVTL